MIDKKYREEKKRLKEEKKNHIKSQGGRLKYLINKLKNSKIGIKVESIIQFIYKKIEKSIRFELMIVFLICFLISFCSYGVIKSILSSERVSSRIEYDYKAIESIARDLAINIQDTHDTNSYDYDESNKIEGINDVETIDKLIKNKVDVNEKRKIYITDLDGKVVYNANGDGIEKVDIFGVINKSSSSVVDGGEKTVLYPVQLNEDRAYLIYSETPTPLLIEDYYTIEYSFLSLLLSVIIFIAIFIIITNRKMRYIDEIAKGVRIIAEGNLDYRIEEKGKDEIKNLANDINHMAEDIKYRMEKERIAEKTKSELITNVSHDLRTPLTSVMGYIGLVKDKKYENDEMMSEYLDIAFSKSNQLKYLIDDLFEYTKLNNNGILLNKEKINLSEFLPQLIEEYVPLFEEENLTVSKKILLEKAIVEIDINKIIRVLENLFTNAIKYSYKPGEVVISMYESGEYVTVAIRNRGDNIEKEKMDRLFDRFYRVDEARNSNVKGSGLGLAISKNIIELHQGKIYGECVGNDITFFIKLKRES